MTFRAFALLFLTIAAFFANSFETAVPHRRIPVDLHKRDDFDPARVPYVFPPPGTDPVSHY